MQRTQYTVGLLGIAALVSVVCQAAAGQGRGGSQSATPRAMQSYSTRAAMARSRAQAQNTVQNPVQNAPPSDTQPQPEELQGVPTELGNSEGPGPVEYGDQIELKPGQDLTIGRGGDVVITPVPPMRGRPKWKPRFKIAPMNIPTFTEPGPAHDYFFESARNTMMGLAQNAPWELRNGYGNRRPRGYQDAWPAGDMAGSTPVIPHGGLTDYSGPIDYTDSGIGPWRGWQGNIGPGPLPYAHELPGESIFDDEPQVVDSESQPTPAGASPPMPGFEEVPSEMLKPTTEETPSEEPAPEQPVDEQPATDAAEDRPLIERDADAAIEWLLEDEPSNEHRKTEKPAGDAPASDEPTSESPVGEEPATEPVTPEAPQSGDETSAEGPALGPAR